MGRLRFEELPEDAQKEFLSFPLSVNILSGTEDQRCSGDLFASDNSYSVPLMSKRSLTRNTLVFKKAMIDLARDHLAYGDATKNSNGAPIARIKDVELTCELVGACSTASRTKKDHRDNVQRL